MNLNIQNLPITDKRPNGARDPDQAYRAMTDCFLNIQRWSRNISPQNFTDILTSISSTALGTWTSTSTSYVNLGGQADVSYEVTGASVVLLVASFGMFVTTAAGDLSCQIKLGSTEGQTHLFRISAVSVHQQKTIFASFSDVSPGSYDVMVQVKRNSGTAQMETDAFDSVNIWGLQLG